MLLFIFKIGFFFKGGEIDIGCFVISVLLRFFSLDCCFIGKVILLMIGILWLGCCDILCWGNFGFFIYLFWVWGWGCIWFSVIMFLLLLGGGRVWWVFVVFIDLFWWRDKFLLLSVVFNLMFLIIKMIEVKLNVFFI